MSTASPANPCVAAPRRPERGFTLVEVVVSTAIISIVMLACVSVLLLAQRALDVGAASGPGAQAAAAREAVDVITADLKVAASIPERTPTAVTITVPDRTGDDVPETIRYAWSGTPGDPLTRQVDGGLAAVIAEDVQNLDLGYLLKSVGPVPPEESGEQVLIYHDDAPGGSLKDYTMDRDSWCGTYFRPALPANAVSWKIARVLIRARQEGNPTESMAVEIRHADAAYWPTLTVIDSVVVPESSLPASYGWVEVPFTTASGLDPAWGFCLVLRQISNIDKVAKIQWEDDVTEANNIWVETDNAGSPWKPLDLTKHLRFYVYGTVTTQP